MRKSVWRKPQHTDWAHFPICNNLIDTFKPNKWFILNLHCSYTTVLELHIFSPKPHSVILPGYFPGALAPKKRKTSKSPISIWKIWIPQVQDTTCSCTTFTPTRSQSTESVLAVAENNQPSTCGSALAPAEAAHGTFRSVHTGKSFFRFRHKDRHFFKNPPSLFGVWRQHCSNIHPFVLTTWFKMNLHKEVFTWL